MHRPLSITVRCLFRNLFWQFALWKRRGAASWL